MFAESLLWTGREWTVVDEAKLKYAVNRLNPRRDILRRLARVFPSRPDLAWTIANYAKQFGRDVHAADLVTGMLSADPPYSAAVADLADALDVCEPAGASHSYRASLRKAEQRCVEDGPRLAASSLTFRLRRTPGRRGEQLLRGASGPLAASSAIAGVYEPNPRRLSSASEVMDDFTKSSDPDLARYAAHLMLSQHYRVGGAWRPSRTVHPAVICTTIDNELAAVEAAVRATFGTA